MAKTKALISFAVTAKLICVFVFAYAKSRFSHDAAQIWILSAQCTRYEKNDEQPIHVCIQKTDQDKRPKIAKGINYR